MKYIFFFLFLSRLTKNSYNLFMKRGLLCDPLCPCLTIKYFPTYSIQNEEIFRAPNWFNGFRNICKTLIVSYFGFAPKKLQVLLVFILINSSVSSFSHVSNFYVNVDKKLYMKKNWIFHFQAYIVCFILAILRLGLEKCFMG